MLFYIEEKLNSNIFIQINLFNIFNKYKSEITDSLIIKLAKSKILKSILELNLRGSKVTRFGIKELFQSKYLNEKFKVIFNLIFF